MPQCIDMPNNLDDRIQETVKLIWFWFINQLELGDVGIKQTFLSKIMILLVYLYSAV